MQIVFLHAHAQTIFEAAEKGNLETVKGMVQADQKIIASRDNEGDTPLHAAAGGRSGEQAALAIVRFILDQGAELEAKNSVGQTPLLYAAYAGYGQVLELFISKGAVFQYQDSRGRSPLHYAARQGFPHIVEMLIKRGADASLKDGENRTPLEYAVLRNKPAVVETLMRLVPIDVKTDQGSMLLHSAAAQGGEELFRKLIAQGADASRPSPTGETILLSLLRGGLASLAREYISKGIDVNSRDARGRTALHLAVRNGMDDVVLLLLDKGADASAADANGRTVMDIARDWQYESLESLLIKRGARVSGKKIHILQRGSYEIVEKPGGPTRDAAEIRYIANDGFLIRAGYNTVLVDGLVQNPWGYDNTPRRALELFQTGWAPFAHLDLLLFSHAHRDHFEPGMALQMLAANPQAELVGDSLVLKDLKAEDLNAYTQYASRIKTTSIGIGERTYLTAGGIAIKVLGVNHGEPDRPYLTLGFIMKLGEYTIYHQGDINAGVQLRFLSSISWEDVTIDIAFFDPFFLLNNDARKIVLDRIRPSAVILMHMREGEADGYLRQLQTSVPQVIAFQEPMESKVFVKPDKR